MSKGSELKQLVLSTLFFVIAFCLIIGSVAYYIYSENRINQRRSAILAGREAFKKSVAKNHDDKATAKPVRKKIALRSSKGQNKKVALKAKRVVTKKKVKVKKLKKSHKRQTKKLAKTKLKKTPKIAKTQKKLAKKKRVVLASSSKKSSKKPKKQNVKSDKRDVKKAVKKVVQKEKKDQPKKVKPKAVKRKVKLATKMSKEVAYIEIEKLGVVLPVFPDTSKENLRRGVGLVDTTALPSAELGTTCAIAGHRGGYNGKDTFLDIDRLGDGDLVYMTTKTEDLTYVFSKKIVVKSDDWSHFNTEQDRSKLILVTCHPYPQNTDRLLVIFDILNDEG